MPSQPPAASMMFHQPGEPVAISRLSRARISGSARRAFSESRAALLRPARDRRFESGAAGGVDVHVGGDVDAARARRLDRLAHRVHQHAPARLVRDLEVEDLDRHARALADRDRFLDRLDDFLAFAANVARVDAAVFRRRLRDFDQLVGRRVAATADR